MLSNVSQLQTKPISYRLNLCLYCKGVKYRHNIVGKSLYCVSEKIFMFELQILQKIQIFDRKESATSGTVEEMLWLTINAEQHSF